MKRGKIEQIAAIVVLVIFGGVIIHAPLTVWVSAHWPSLTLIVKAWKELLMVIAAGLLVVSVTRQHAWGRLWHQSTVQLAVVFTTLHALTAVMTWHGISTLAGLMIDLRFVAYFLLVMALLVVAPGYQRRFVQVGVGGAVVVLGFAAFQWLLPHDFLAIFGYGPSTIQPYLTIDQNEAFVRLQSTLRGPNPLGMYAMMALSGLLAYMSARWKGLTSHQRIWCGVGLLLGANALIFSQSRSAWLAMGAAGIMIGSPYVRMIPRRLWYVLMSAVVIVGIVFATQATFVSNVFFHENPGESGALNSNDGHAQSLSQGLTRLLVQPLGAGIGSTGSASLLSDNPLIVENYYLFVAHEVGWLGLVIFMWLLATTIHQAWQRRREWGALAVAASGVGIAIASILLPVLTDDTVSIIWWGIAAAVLAKTAKR